MPTLQRIYREYCDTVLVQVRSGEATARSLALLVEPYGRRSVETVGSELVERRLHEIAETAPVHAKRIRSYTRSFFKWMAERGWVTEDPTAGVYIDAPDRVRGRQLSLDEVVMIWRASDALSERLAYGARLLILTAASRQQVAAMRLSEFQRDPVQGSIYWQASVPLEGRGEARRLLLPSLTCQIVEAAVANRNPSGEFILSRAGKTPLDGWSKAKRELDAELARRRDGGLSEPWWLNDLRTSFPALAIEHAGVDAMVAEACLGRTSRYSNPDTKLWLQASVMDEHVSEALAAWDDVLRKTMRLAKKRS
ncbi:MAG TPA: hypothetical protein VGM25_10960 [Caulobacteraceae bacterium]|jgi:integrase